MIILDFAQVQSMHAGKRQVFGYFQTIGDAELAVRDAGRDDLLQPRTTVTDGKVQCSPANPSNLATKKRHASPATCDPATLATKIAKPDKVINVTKPDLMNSASSSSTSAVLVTKPCMHIFVRVMILLRGRSCEYSSALGWVLTMPGMVQYIASQSWAVLSLQAMKSKKIVG